MEKPRVVNLTSDERSFLQKLLSAGSALARVQTKARILLLTDHSQGGHRTDRDIIKALGTSVCTIGRTRQAFCTRGLEAALWDKARSGKPPKITGDIEAKLTMLACSEPPDDRSRWTVRLLADKMVELEYIDYISAVTVSKRLKKANSNHGSFNPGASASRAASTSPKWKTS
jgi:transposase